MTIKGLVFDFDGLILDTETPEYDVLQDIFHSLGTDLPITDYAAALGSSFAAFDPFVYLEEKVGHPVDQKSLFRSYKEQSLDIINRQPPLLGVPQVLDRARQLGLILSVASSSPGTWVKPHLDRLGLTGYFEIILTSEDVNRVKPDPELYLKAVEKMGIKPAEAIAFEDSPNGILAARKAGLFCVAVPNSVTLQLDTDHADLVVESLLAVSLDELVEIANSRTKITNSMLVKK
jgi:HAD superfamily hydrolase (TIGR01509 family)